jgi:hypothetical protein
MFKIIDTAIDSLTPLFTNYFLNFLFQTKVGFFFISMHFDM